jgi:hypothetical protein
MADLTKTISNSLNVFGGGAPTLWGNTGRTTMTWGTDFWGQGSEDYIQDVGKTLENTLTLASTISTQLEIRLTISNSLAVTSETTGEYLTDRNSSAAWFYLFPGGAANAESRVSSTYANGSASSTSFTVSSAVSTVWA